jgi:hypothetical protein
VVIAVIYLRSTPADELLKTGLLVAVAIFCLAGRETPYVGAAAALAITIMSCLTVLITGNFFAIVFALGGAIGMLPHLHRIVRGGSG